MERAVKRILLMLVFMLVIGCSSISSNEYVEGTSLKLGIYLPYNGNIYGLQAVNYLSGKRIRLNTNQTFKVSSQHSISNETFSIFKIYDNSTTDIGE